MHKWRYPFQSKPSSSETNKHIKKLWTECCSQVHTSFEHNLLRNRMSFASNTIILELEEHSSELVLKDLTETNVLRCLSNVVLMQCRSYPQKSSNSSPVFSRFYLSISIISQSHFNHIRSSSYLNHTRTITILVLLNVHDVLNDV